jgi:Tfp pilus assembly protein PilV
MLAKPLRSPPIRRRHQAGSSLIESMIAAGIFSFGVLGLVPLFFRSAEGSAVATHMTQATSLAQSKLDELSHTSFGDDSLKAGDYHDEYNVDVAGVATASNYGTNDTHFGRAWTVTDQEVNAALVGPDLKIIRVEVSWWDQSVKRRRSVVLTGAKANVQ